MHDFEGRSRRFWRELEERGLDGLVLSRPASLTYLFNFTATAGYACCWNGESWLVVDSRYLELADASARCCTPVLAVESLEETLRQRCTETARGGGRMGFESRHLSWEQAARMQAWELPLEWIPVADLVETLRSVKEPAEVEVLEKAFEISGRALEAILEEVCPGVSELEVAGLLEYEMRCQGSEGIAFETIVASGPRTSLPHGTPSQRRIRKGEYVLIDFGARFRGYCSDMTRIHTPPGAALPDFYPVVEDARQKALEVVRPGVLSSEIDAAARQVIARAGYGEYFRHSTGHGLGIEVHELPVISPRHPTPIQEGMVFTIEPAIYLPRRAGIRLEDALVVTSDGFRLLSPQRSGLP